MRYLALATDYDGTLAHDGHVDAETLAALERLLASGRKLILVTGRELDELLTVFPHTDLFEWVVAENGALLYQPSTRESKVLAEPPPERFVAALRQRGAQRLSVGRAIVATVHPYETDALEAIRELGLELQVIFNKGSVMVLPSGINKATGLSAVLKEMALSPHNVVGVGDAENDHAFLSLCECSAAVANALPTLKETADLVTRGARGAGVTEVIDDLLADDFARYEARLHRHHILLGKRADGKEERLKPFRTSLLIAGPSGSGKSTVAAGFLERLAEQGYQFCIIDPEGDYETFGEAAVLGTSERGPSPEEVLHLLKDPGQNVAANLVGLPITERPPFFLKLLPGLLELRARTGRPHWLVIDEAHHLLPKPWQPARQALPPAMDRMVLITVHPDEVAPAVLASVDTVVAVGRSPEDTLRRFAAAVGENAPVAGSGKAETGEVLVWKRGSSAPALRMCPVPSRSEHRRHSRKYAEGELPPDRSFYFRGPEGKLKLRAQNLLLFLQIAEGIDDGTWTYHLRQGDYSRWFREMIKDDALGAEVARIEKLGVCPAESRALIKAAIEAKYTAPASAPLPMPDTDAEPKYQKG